MNERELWLQRKALYDQIHFTVIYETEILLDITVYQLYIFRDKILDDIISVERKLGLRQ